VSEVRRPLRCCHSSAVRVFFCEKKTASMAERLNTAVCIFDPSTPRISTFEIHEWLHEVLCIPQSKVSIIQRDGIKRQAYIKFADQISLQALIRDTNGTAEYKYNTGEIFQVTIAIAGLGTKNVRILNLPPGVMDDKIRAALAAYGTILNITEEKWAQSYSYPVPSGVRVATVTLTRHIPSHIAIAGNGVHLT
jgi:hypothetical protein